MDRNLLIIFLSLLLIIIPLVSADIIVPLSMITLPLIPLIVIIESLLFWVVINRGFKVKTGFWKTFGVVFIANFVTSLLGSFFVIPAGSSEAGMFIGVSFIASIFIEWACYLPFFRKSKITSSNLLKISLLVNLASYLPLFFYIT